MIGRMTMDVFARPQPPHCASSQLVCLASGEVHRDLLSRASTAFHPVGVVEHEVSHLEYEGTIGANRLKGVL